MATDQTLDEVLEHYGILGMKWGVRRDKRQLRRAREVSEDAKKAAESRKKAKKGGVKSLTNEELQQLSIRLNLEKNYDRLTAKKSLTKEFQEGQKIAENLARAGKTANDIRMFIRSPLGKQIGSTLLRKKS